MSADYNKRVTIKLTPANAAKLRTVQEHNPLTPSINRLANLAVECWDGKTTWKPWQPGKAKR